MIKLPCVCQMKTIAKEVPFPPNKKCEGGDEKVYATDGGLTYSVASYDAAIHTKC